MQYRFNQIILNNNINNETTHLVNNIFNDYNNIFYTEDGKKINITITINDSKIFLQFSLASNKRISSAFDIDGWEKKINGKTFEQLNDLTMHIRQNHLNMWDYDNDIAYDVKKEK